MTVRELMTTSLVTVTPDTPVLDARQRMIERRLRHLLVCEPDGAGRRLVGIVTDRDIRLNLPSPATSLSVWEVNYLLSRLTVGQVMTTAVIAVDPARSARQAARILVDHKIGAMPVLDGNQLVGIVTETDLLRAFAESEEPAPTPAR